jgi:hypothetical protein
VSGPRQAEADVLSRAAGQISEGLCLWCPTRTWRLRWSQAGDRWQLVVVHSIRCRATRTLWNRRRADEFVHGLLMFHGCGIAHWGEDNLIIHSKLVVL